MSTAYCTTAQVKSALDLQTTNDDTWIASDLIPEAQAAIDDFIGHSYGNAVFGTRFYNGKGTDRLFVDECSSVTLCYEVQKSSFVDSNGVWQSNTTQTVDITNDLVLMPNNRALGYYLERKSGIPFWEGRQNYQVVATYGDPTVPADITRACVRLVVTWYKLRDANYADSLSETGGVRQHFSKRMPDDVVEILERRRRRLFLTR